jgi:hypothetical protein
MEKALWSLSISRAYGRRKRLTSRALDRGIRLTVGAAHPARRTNQKASSSVVWRLAKADRAPDPDRAARLPRLTIVAALRRAGRPDLDGKATIIRQILKADQLRQPRPVQNAYVTIVSSQVQLINILNIEIAELGQVAADHFGQHRDAERYLSLPGLGTVLGARILGEFGDDPHRYADGKARRNYAATRHVALRRYTGDLVKCWVC